MQQLWVSCSWFSSLLRSPWSQPRPLQTEFQWTSVGISTQWPSHMRAVLLSFLSTVSRGFVSLGMFWMWPAMDLVSDCGHPPRTVWLPWGWDICWGLLAGSCVLTFDRKAVVAGSLQSVTFKTRSVTLVEGHWDPGNRRPLEENDPLWWTLRDTLAWYRTVIPKQPKHHHLDQRLCYPMAVQAVFWLLNWRLFVEGRDLIARQSFLCSVISRTFPTLKILTDLLPHTIQTNSLVWVPISWKLLHSQIDSGYYVVMWSI